MLIILFYCLMDKSFIAIWNKNLNNTWKFNIVYNIIIKIMYCEGNLVNQKKWGPNWIYGWVIYLFVKRNKKGT